MSTFSPNSAFGAQNVPVQLGLCLGDLITTWSPDSPTPQLWKVQDAASLASLMYRGKISKVGRGEGFPGRYREAAMLDKANRMLSVTVDGESEPRLFALSDPSDIDGKQTTSDLIGALKSATQLVADGKVKMVLLEQGGLVAPSEPVALFTIHNGRIVVKAQPTPRGSHAWDQILKHDQEAGMVTTPVSEKGMDSAALLLVEAARTWGVTPWDLALTYVV